MLNVDVSQDALLGSSLYLLLLARLLEMRLCEIYILKVNRKMFAGATYSTVPHPKLYRKKLPQFKK